MPFGPPSCPMLQRICDQETPPVLSRLWFLAANSAATGQRRKPPLPVQKQGAAMKSPAAPNADGSCGKSWWVHRRRCFGPGGTIYGCFDQAVRLASAKPGMADKQPPAAAIRLALNATLRGLNDRHPPHCGLELSEQKVETLAVKKGE